ncbi:MAG TPA: NAD(P)H-dependent oxidoreductase [Lactovum miscens]|uniref:flavodoxin family protein n=1 Tax=Lactovum miscens TaxID=190387 RepID=UPI002ED7A054
MVYLFINASPNKGGSTARIARDYFKGQDYKQVNLVDYNIKQLGQDDARDDFEEVRMEIQNANDVVIGTPVYWSDMTGLLKTFIDRHVDTDNNYAGKKLKIIVQGFSPTNDEVKAISHIMQHWAERFKMTYGGII